jgi:hypothetical protein
MYICMYIGVSNPLSMQMLTKACVLNFLNEWKFVADLLFIFNSAFFFILAIYFLTWNLIHFITMLHMCNYNRRENTKNDWKRGRSKFFMTSNKNGWFQKTQKYQLIGAFGQNVVKIISNMTTLLRILCSYDLIYYIIQQQENISQTFP